MVVRWQCPISPFLSEQFHSGPRRTWPIELKNVTVTIVSLHNMTDWYVSVFIQSYFLRAPISFSKLSNLMLYSFGEKYYNLHLLVTLVVRHTLLILRCYNKREVMNVDLGCCCTTVTSSIVLWAILPHVDRGKNNKSYLLVWTLFLWPNSLKSAQNSAGRS